METHIATAKSEDIAYLNFNQHIDRCILTHTSWTKTG